MNPLQTKIAGLSATQKALLLKKIYDANVAASEKWETETRITSHLVVAHRPLITLFAAGKLPRVDAASIGCLSYQFVRSGRHDLKEITHGFCHDLPVLTSIRETELGIVGTIAIPRFYAQLFSDGQDTLRQIQNALNMAAMIGARTVSLTGLIPSATNYGREVKIHPPLPEITTGHATTTSAVVMTIKRLLEDTGRILEEERFCFVGLGSIGSSTLRLMLKVLPHPAHITLCDLFQRKEAVQALMTEICRDFGFKGGITFLDTQKNVPAEVYDATFFVGATSVPDVLDVSRMKPGTLVVDDSDPHCFAVPEAMRRMGTAGDIIVTEAGALCLPHPIRHTTYLPKAYLHEFQFETGKRQEHNVMGCILSSLLSACHDFPGTVGQVAISDAETHFRQLAAMGLSAADPYCEGHRIDDQTIARFKSHFGH